MSTVLVTGAAGFVGSGVVRRLVDGDTALWDGSPVEHVVAAVRPGASLERLEALSERDGWSIAPVDLDDVAALERLLRRVRPRAVVHTALDASVHEGGSIGHGALDTLVAELGRLDARLVHAGSAWVLAPGDRLAEDAPLDLRSAYTRHKAEEDSRLRERAGRTGVRWLNLRLFNVFGRYERPTRLIPHLVARLAAGRLADVSHGAQVRDFNEVDDVARAFQLALGAPEAAWDALYHIGSGRGTTARDLALMVAGILGRPELVRFGAASTADEAVPTLVADPTLAGRELGWAPGPPLAERVAETVEWWLSRSSFSKRRLPEGMLG